MALQSWGLYPKITSQIFAPRNEASLSECFSSNPSVISYGNGRSYGDSALSSHILHTRHFRYFLAFDDKSGLLHVQSGVLLSEILEVFVPKGWFLQVTPGTKLITIGGAIASDVHGKNHHIVGCFSECVKEFRLMVADGSVIPCSRTENVEFFYATCGGQGLTGVILDAKIFLKRIPSSRIRQKIFRTKNLKHTIELFESKNQDPYSVAWIDCVCKQNPGRSLLMTGDFCESGHFDFQNSQKILIPFPFPAFVLNSFTVRAFNSGYYHRFFSDEIENFVDINSFFYPLDAIHHWNRIYGKKGFLQYQFILPKKTSFEGLEKILHKIASKNMGSFLAVLKLYGKENQNWLSFPLEGYSLALDFKIEEGIFPLLDELDQIVLAHQGRIYLSKDARVSKEIFEKGYEKIDQFRRFRKEHGLDKKFQSLQSKRLFL